MNITGIKYKSLKPRSEIILETEMQVNSKLRIWNEFEYFQFYESNFLLSIKCEFNT